MSISTQSADLAVVMNIHQYYTLLIIRLLPKYHKCAHEYTHTVCVHSAEVLLCVIMISCGEKVTGWSFLLLSLNTSNYHHIQGIILGTAL